jgi:hypothetical protein
MVCSRKLLTWLQPHYVAASLDNFVTTQQTTTVQCTANESHVP